MLMNILVTEMKIYVVFLKEQCHEDFALLGQFCTKIIILRL